MMKVPRYIFITLMSAALFACPTIRPKHLLQPEVITTEGTYTHTASGMTFPAKIGHFQRSTLLRYDTESLALSAGYNLVTVTGSVAASVFVYPAPSLISIGSPPNVVAAARGILSQNEFEARKRETLHYHPGAVLIQEREVSLQHSNTPYAGKMAIFDFEEVFAGQRQPLQSHLYLFCFAGGKWAIKYRFTHPRNFDASKDIDEFMKNLPWTLTSS